MHKKQLSVTMNRRETVLGLCFLPFYLILLSIGLELLFLKVFHRAAEQVELNACYYAINILTILLVFRRFLKENLKLVRWKKTVAAAGIALAAYFAVSMQVNGIILALYPEFANQNNNTIMGMLDMSPVFVLIMSVILAPIVEETLFRGLIFGNLLRVNDILAYLITILGFAAIHVVGYIGVLTPLEILLSILQYVPASLVLCACYQITDSIITPILLHSVINLIACAAMQVMNIMG